MEALFPFTKFLPPQLDERVVVSRIIERLDAAVATHPLTVVCAPAGSGKTTALAAWARQVRGPVAWVRFGPDDDTLQVASAALLEGVRRVEGYLGARLEEALAKQETAASASHLATSLVNDLEDAPALHLVFDDFHELRSTDTLALFDALLDHLPSSTRIVIASRTEPALSLARRRVRGELTEIGLRDLRLDEASIRAVLGHDGEVEDEVVRSVARASRGWAAAVRLSAAGFGSEPTRGPDLVSAVQPELWRFLAEEVLDGQPDDLREFLLETSILEEMTPEVCAHVSGRTDAADVLDELERRHLFVARFAGDEGPAWRYHDLFAAFLRDRLKAGRSDVEVTALHRRAAEVLPPVRAVPHLLAAGDHERVAALAVELALAELDPSILFVVIPWVRALPAELLDRDHRLPLLLAWRDEVDGRADDIVARLQPLHDRLRSTGDDLAAAEIGLELAAGHLMRGELGEAGRLLDAAFEQPLEGWWRIAALALRMHWARESGDWALSSAAVEEAFAHTLATDDPGVHRIFASALSSQLLFVDQGPAWTLEQTRRLAARLDGPATSASLAGLRPLLAAGALLDLDLETAAEQVRRCLATSAEFGRLAWTHQEAECLLLTLALVSGDHATVRTVVDDALGRIDAPIEASMRAFYAGAAARSAYLREDLAGLDAVVGLLADVARPEEAIGRTIAETLHARLAGNADAFVAPLAEAEATQRDRRCWLETGLPGLERATILLEQGRTIAAVEAAEPTLATATELGPGILLPDVSGHVPLLRACAEAGVHPEVVQAVLAAVEASARPTAVAVPGTSERLSPRELEVLAYVAEGRSNREIATALFISDVTVKSHLTRILRKLDASSRTHAVARARELHLL